MLAVLAHNETASAHVPYFEWQDLTAEVPFRVRAIEQSIAVYAWLERKDGRTDDIDVYGFTLAKPARVFVQCLVPVRRRYRDFLPAFAVVGPDLPLAEAGLPFEVPAGHGVLVMPNYRPGEQRPSFYEFFGGKHYYRGPTFDRVLEKPGTYNVYIWDPHARGGDYVAVLGYEETWGLLDVLRALIYTPMIRWNLELHDGW
jgi:hypothetical protein